MLLIEIRRLKMDVTTR